MSTRINFTVNYSIDFARRKRHAAVKSVTNGADEDISEEFFRFCRERSLPLSSETEIESATFEYGKSYSGRSATQREV